MKRARELVGEEAGLVAMPADLVREIIREQSYIVDLEPEKALAALRHGITTFVLPALNARDISELPAEVRNGMQFIPASTLEDVLKVALPGADIQM